MDWAYLLACVTGMVNQELLLLNEYLAIERVRNNYFDDDGFAAFTYAL